jgi:hypothetical protein
MAINQSARQKAARWTEFVLATDCRPLKLKVFVSAIINTPMCPLPSHGKKVQK